MSVIKGMILISSYISWDLPSATPLSFYILHRLSQRVFIRILARRYYYSLSIFSWRNWCIILDNLSKAIAMTLSGLRPRLIPGMACWRVEIGTLSLPDVQEMYEHISEQIWISRENSSRLEVCPGHWIRSGERGPPPDKELLPHPYWISFQKRGFTKQIHLN